MRGPNLERVEKNGIFSFVFYFFFQPLFYWVRLIVTFKITVRLLLRRCDSGTAWMRGK